MQTSLPVSMMHDAVPIVTLIRESLVVFSVVLNQGDVGAWVPELRADLPERLRGQRRILCKTYSYCQSAETQTHRGPNFSVVSSQCGLRD